MHQPESAQREFLRQVLQESTWKGRELRMSLKEPFQKIALSNSASAKFSSSLNAHEGRLAGGPPWTPFELFSRIRSQQENSRTPLSIFWINHL
jgi:hypothetical protein